ncbi:UNVERIFIED_CONTAM: hypothetical protein GTU68_016157 [Idotea baltica]|nr:hypothetical protein [Idotea baltica]
MPRQSELRKQCQFCPKSFVDTWHLKRHLRCHTGEKPYGCPICPYKASQSGNVKLHLKHTHKIPFRTDMQIK